MLNNFSIDLRFSSSLSSYMVRSTLRVVLFAFSVAFIPTGSTAAESGKLIKTYSDWSVFKDHEYCWALSQPVSSRASQNGRPFDLSAVNRFDILFYVLFEPSPKDGRAVMVNPGFKPVNVEMLENNKSHSFLIDGEWAGPVPGNTDLFIRKIATQSSTVIRSVSKGGLVIEDTYSLKGSTAAIKEAQRICGR